MKENKEIKKTRNITFRLTDEEYAQVEKAASAAGDDPNNWCRKVAIDKSGERFALSKNEHLLYQEIALKQEFESMPKEEPYIHQLLPGLRCRHVKLG